MLVWTTFAPLPPACCAGCERNERHYHRGHRPVAFAITLGVLLTDLWPSIRKRPNAPKGNDDA
jgi:hypothetical protein